MSEETYGAAKQLASFRSTSATPSITWFPRAPDRRFRDAVARP